MLRAISTGVSHISAYHLTLEPNTHSTTRRRRCPTTTWLPTCRKWSKAGSPPPASHTTKPRPSPEPDQLCRHNLNYWNFGDYLGIGAGAHSKLSNHDTIWREARHRNPRAYLDGAVRGDFISSQAADRRAPICPANS